MSDIRQYCDCGLVLHAGGNLRARFGDVAELLDVAEHDVLAYMAFDESLRSRLHSTNPLERVNKEIKQRPTSSGFGHSFEPVAVMP